MHSMSCYTQSCKTDVKGSPRWLLKPSFYDTLWNYHWAQVQPRSALKDGENFMEGRALTLCLHFGNALNSGLEIFPWLPITQRTKSILLKHLLYLFAYFITYYVPQGCHTCHSKGHLAEAASPIPPCGWLSGHPLSHLGSTENPSSLVASIYCGTPWHSKVRLSLYLDSHDLSFARSEISTLYPGSPAEQVLGKC